LDELTESAPTARATAAVSGWRGGQLREARSRRFVGSARTTELDRLRARLEDAESTLATLEAAGARDEGLSAAIRSMRMQFVRRSKVKGRRPQKQEREGDPYDSGDGGAGGGTGSG